MKKSIIAFTIGSCFLFACNNSKDTTGTEAALVPDSSLQQNNEPSLTQTTERIPPAIDSGTTETHAVSMPSSPPQQSAPVAAGMNPAHGEPNHRCDIAVGAPLNSAPTKTVAPDPGMSVTPSISPAPTLIPSAAPGNASAPAAPTTAAPTATAPGMNPPHGQPGHDCAIAVGAPLKK